MKVTRTDKAILIAQAKNAWLSPPECTDPLVITILDLPDDKIEELYTWAVGAMSAMRWNTATLGIRC